MLRCLIICLPSSATVDSQNRCGRLEHPHRRRKCWHARPSEPSPHRGLQGETPRKTPQRRTHRNGRHHRCQNRVGRQGRISLSGAQTNHASANPPHLATPTEEDKSGEGVESHNRLNSGVRVCACAGRPGSCQRCDDPDGQSVSSLRAFLARCRAIRA